MAIIELSMVVGAIVEMGVEAVWDKTKRREAVIKVLRKAGLKPDAPPTDFDGIYAYTLVEYGVWKPRPVLDFFRHEFIRTAFRKSFEARDPAILQAEAESLIEWHRVGEELNRLDIDPRREFARFTAVFNEIVDRTRTPADVRRDQKLDDIYGDLHQKADEILERLERLTGLDSIRHELARLADSYQARRFVLVPTGDRIKVFVSSRMTELHEVRESVAKALDERGIEAWVFEVHGGARPENVIETSLREVEAADIYVGLFWRTLGDVTVQEYRRARALGKPCFVYIRNKDIIREKPLEDFLQANVCDVRCGVTYRYFESATALGQQVSDDIVTWLVRQYREMTAELRQAQVSQDEIARLQGEVDRLQAASRNPLPRGAPVDYLALELRTWFEALGYGFEDHATHTETYFEWVINVPGARRRYERILVRGVEGEAKASDVRALRQGVEARKTDEAWLISARRVSQLARDEVDSDDGHRVFCFTFDELLDETADFSQYFDWLEAEVKSRGIDKIYLPLACRKNEHDPFTGAKIGTAHYDARNGWIDGYVDWWLDDPSKEHLSVLGEFGTGKTWFALHYAWTMLQRFRSAQKRGVERPRLPLVIPLRDFARAASVESLFSEFFFRKHDIRLPNYAAFERLNRMGKLLLILDGFDEMAVKVDRQRMIDHFWELAKVVVPGGKVILTCRTEHFPTAQESYRLLGAELRGPSSRLSGEPPQFEVLELEAFNEEQVRKVLSFRTDPATVDQVMGSSQLLDLARRPIMTELILDALPDIEAGKPVDLARVYLYAVQRKMQREIKSGLTFTSLADKLYFLAELSWEMLSLGSMSLNYRDFPDRIRQLFGPVIRDQTDLDHWRHDMMGRSLLTRDELGNYEPAHRSIAEFLAAYKIAAEMGALAPDFLDLAKQQAHVDPYSPSAEYTWTTYFHRTGDGAGRTEQMAPLKAFVAEPLRRLVDTAGCRPLSKAVLVMLAGMTEQEALWEMVRATRHEAFPMVRYLGGNALGALKLTGTSLQARDFSETVLAGVDLSDTDLRGADFTRADLREANLSNTVLENALLIETDLTGADIEEWGAVSSIASYPEGNEFATAVFDLTIKFWHLTNWERMGAIRNLPSPPMSICYSSDGSLLVCGHWDGSVIVWQREAPRWKQLHRVLGNFPVYSVAIRPDNHLIAAADLGGNVHVWEMATWQRQFSKRIHEGAAFNVRFNPVTVQLASCGADGSIKLLDTDKWQASEMCAERGLRVKSIAWSPTGDLLASGHGNGEVRLWNVAGASPLATVQAHCGEVMALDWSDDGVLIASGGIDRTVAVWEALGHTPSQKVAEYTDTVFTVQFTPDDRYLVSGSDEWVIRVWDRGTGSLRILHQSNWRGAVMRGVRGIEKGKESWLQTRITPPWESATPQLGDPTHQTSPAIVEYHWSPEMAPSLPKRNPDAIDVPSFGSEVVEVDDLDFEQIVLKARVPVLAEFSTSWCGPSQRMNIVLERLAEEYRGRALVTKVDIDKCTRAFVDHKIEGIPTLIIFLDGVPIVRMEGWVPKHLLEAKLNYILFPEITTTQAHR